MYTDVLNTPTYRCITDVLNTPTYRRIQMY